MPENSYMSAYRKQVIKCQSANICSFCVVSVAPFSTPFIDRCIHVFSYSGFFSISYEDISKKITVLDSCSI